MKFNACIFLLPALLFVTGCGKSKAENEAEAAKVAEAARVAEAAKVAKVAKVAEFAQVSSLQSKTADAFKDPSSVQFRKVALNPEKTVLCGEANAKNSFGGYTGFRPFMTSDRADRGVWVSNQKCEEIHSRDGKIACMAELSVFISTAIEVGCRPPEVPGKSVSTPGG